MGVSGRCFAPNEQPSPTKKRLHHDVYISMWWCLFCIGTTG